MGRPIKKKFFGNLNAGSAASTADDYGIGGEGVSSSITVTNTGTGYSQGAVAVFSNPQLPTGVVATGSLTIGAPAAQGRISAVTLTDGGSGYTSTATISITTASAITVATTGSNLSTTLYPASTASLYVGMTVTGDTGLGNGNAPKVTAVNANGTVTVSSANDGAVTANLKFADYGSGFAAITSLTAAVTNALAVRAYIPAKDGGLDDRVADIIKQESSRRYLVQTSDGIGQCKLVAVADASLTAGQMNLIATDWNGSTYYVTKLTARRAYLTQKTMSTAYLIADGASTGWTIGASTGTIVTLSSN